jgi:hypothetical protein
MLSTSKREATTDSFVTYFSIMDTSRLQAGDVYWDDVRTPPPAVETKYDIIGAALDTAGSALVDELGDDESVWPWGKKHGFRLTSLLSSLSEFFDEFSNPPPPGFFANDGGLFTVDVANPDSQGIHSSGPSTRFQCEATEPVQCTIQLPGGQSEHPSSDHYDDLLLLWLDNEPIDLSSTSTRRRPTPSKRSTLEVERSDASDSRTVGPTVAAMQKLSGIERIFNKLMGFAFRKGWAPGYAHELEVDQRPEILAAYLNQYARQVQRFFSVKAGSPLEAFAGIADRHPVFELGTAD